MLHQLEQLGILAEKLLADISAAHGPESLIFAVDALMHALDQQAARIAGQKIVPAAAPNHLDDVPAGAEKRCFQLLDDAAVAAHRPVEPLQVAIDHEDQVVELLTRSQ